MLQEIKLYDEILPVAVKEGLVEISKYRTGMNWHLGELVEIAVKYLAYEQARGRLKGVHNYHLYAAMQNQCHISPRRLEKLARIHESFPPELRLRWAKYDFGYFEKAFELPVRYRIDAMEFLDFYKDEYGRLPQVSQFKWLFRKHILGENLDRLNLDAVPEPISIEQSMSMEQRAPRRIVPEADANDFMAVLNSFIAAGEILAGSAVASFEHLHSALIEARAYLVTLTHAMAKPNSGNMEFLRNTQGVWGAEDMVLTNAQPNIDPNGNIAPG